MLHEWLQPVLIEFVAELKHGIKQASYQFLVIVF